MKKSIKIIAVILIMTMTCALMASCSLESLSNMISNLESGDGATSGTGGSPVTTPGSGGQTGSSNDYMTREEVEELIAGLTPDVDVTEQEITINSNHSTNLLAASKGLLSAVSIVTTFQCAGQPTWPSYQPQTYEAVSGGSGVIYSLDKTKGDAYIITNYHVVYHSESVEDDNISDEIYIYLYGMEYDVYGIPATYVGGSVNYDIAVLKVSGSEILKQSNARAADFADSNEVSVLQTAIAIGNPMGEGMSATVGAITVDSESLTIVVAEDVDAITMRVMRIDAPVNSGNSGGGLFDDEGNLIGIVNAKTKRSGVEGVGYAIPSNVAKAVADNIIYYDNINSANDGVYRIILGIYPAITEAGAEYDETTGIVRKTHTIVVGNIDAGSVVNGLIAVNDIINSITVDGVTYEVTRDFVVIDAMLNARQTSTVSFNVTSGDTTKDVTIDVSGITPVKW